MPRASELATIQDVVAAHAQHRTEYDHILLSVSWSKLGRLVRTETKAAREVRRDPVALCPLASDTEEALLLFNAKTLSNTVMGVASLRRHGHWDAGEALWTGLVERSCELARDMAPMHLVMTARASATAGAAPAGLGERRTRSSGMGARLDTALIEAVAEAAAPRLHEFAPRELSGLAWACAVRVAPAPPPL